jgi:hypothetical protein
LSIITTSTHILIYNHQQPQPLHSKPIFSTQTINMLYTTILAFAVAAFAAPLEDKRQVGLCASGSPVCCATDVLNLANLDCAPRELSQNHLPDNSNS